MIMIKTTVYSAHLYALNRCVLLLTSILCEYFTITATTPI